MLFKVGKKETKKILQFIPYFFQYSSLIKSKTLLKAPKYPSQFLWKLLAPI